MYDHTCICIPHPVLQCGHGLQGACMYMSITDVHGIMYYKGPHPQIRGLYNHKPLPTMLYLYHTPYKHHFIHMLYAHVNRDTQCIEVKATAKCLGSKIYLGQALFGRLSFFQPLGSQLHFVNNTLPACICNSYCTCMRSIPRLTCIHELGFITKLHTELVCLAIGSNIYSQGTYVYMATSIKEMGSNTFDRCFYTCIVDGQLY